MNAFWYKNQDIFSKDEAYRWSLAIIPLDKNLERDIILWKTHIWPHIDDFEIVINNKSLIDFASRWEIKSVLISLKLLEIEYIKNISQKHPIVLIDDFNSEIDENHQKILSP